VVERPADIVVRALEERDCSPRGSNGKLSARCPAHDDHVASLSVGEGADGRALVHCHAGCETAAVVAALSLREADLFEVRENGRAAPVPRPATEAARGPQDTTESTFKPPSAKALDRLQAALTDKELRRLAELRGWSPEACRKLGLGLEGDRIVFPVRDAAAVLVAVSRFVPSPERTGPKMQADPGSRRELFPAPETLGDGDVWIVEGEPDAVAAATLGLRAVGVPGANCWRSEWATTWKQGHPWCDRPWTIWPTTISSLDSRSSDLWA